MNSNRSGFGVLIIGDEILSGRRHDKHLDQAIQILTQHGQHLCWARYAGDDETRLVQQFREIRQLGDPCFSFGGIGATVDDRTRQAIAKAFDRKLQRHPDAVQEIEARFGAQAYPHRILMADLPNGAEIIPNPYNRVPGFSLGAIHCLPGFPQMAWPMMEWVLQTNYHDLPKSKSIQYSFIVNDVHESDVVDILEQFQQAHPGVKVSSLPSLAVNGHRQIELGVYGPQKQATDGLNALKDKLIAHGLISSG